jgi:hypothetical protein
MGNQLTGRIIIRALGEGKPWFEITLSPDRNSFEGKVTGYYHFPSLIVKGQRKK